MQNEVKKKVHLKHFLPNYVDLIGLFKKNIENVL